MLGCSEYTAHSTGWVPAKENTWLRRDDSWGGTGQGKQPGHGQWRTILPYSKMIIPFLWYRFPIPLTVPGSVGRTKGSLCWKISKAHFQLARFAMWKGQCVEKEQSHFAFVKIKKIRLCINHFTAREETRKSLKLKRKETKESFQTLNKRLLIFYLPVFPEVCMHCIFRERRVIFLDSCKNVYFIINKIKLKEKVNQHYHEKQDMPVIFKSAEFKYLF